VFGVSEKKGNTLPFVRTIQSTTALLGVPGGLNLPEFVKSAIGAAVLPTGGR
jgi:hypothetical protein